MVYHKCGPLVKWPKTPASHAGNRGSNPLRVTKPKYGIFAEMRLYICKLVFIATRVHPFPSRTRKLSSLVPTILGGRPPGKIGKCQHNAKLPKGSLALLYFTILYSSIAQSVEHAAVNRGVVGSSPTGGATKILTHSVLGFFLCKNTSDSDTTKQHGQSLCK